MILYRFVASFHAPAPTFLGFWLVKSCVRFFGFRGALFQNLGEESSRKSSVRKDPRHGNPPKRAIQTYMYYLFFFPCHSRWWDFAVFQVRNQPKSKETVKIIKEYTFTSDVCPNLILWYYTFNVLFSYTYFSHSYNREWFTITLEHLSFHIIIINLSFFVWIWYYLIDLLHDDRNKDYINITFALKVFDKKMSNY